MKCWYALYTKPRAEKKAEEELIEKGIETFLPLQKTLKKWSDRKKWIKVPLIRSYLFIKANRKELYRAEHTPGILKVIRFGGIPEPIPEEQINIIRYLIEKNYNIEVSSEIFNLGDSIEIVQGKLKGLKGYLVQHRGKYKVLLRINTIEKVFLVEVSKHQLQHIKKEDAIVNDIY